MPTTDDQVPPAPGTPRLEHLDAASLRTVVVTFRDLLRAHSPAINRLNVYPVPDGDTGTNMTRTVDAVVAALAEAPAGLDETCEAIGHGSLMGARGNSGVILSQVLRGLAGALRAAPGGAISSAEVADGLQAASDLAYRAVLHPIEGTILTVVRCCAEAAVAATGEGEALTGVLLAARRAGRDALDRTPELLDALRRAGVVDAGGAGFLLLLDAALHVVAGEPLPDAEPGLADASPPSAGGAGLGHDPDATRYEVMYLLDLADERIDELRRSWAVLGDSIAVVGGDGMWNCHVHTNDIGGAIEAALALDGRPRSIRVTDLLEEVALLGGEAHARRDGAASRPATGLPAVECAVVAVSSGDGLTELFGQLGVQGVVSGGQTLNPSTAELLAAVEAVNATQVVVLPNNKNVVAVAEQLDALSAKQVVVVPTCSMPEGLSALAVYDPESSAVGNAEQMRAATQAVVTGEVTRAVRDTDTAIGPVRAGDWIGVVRGDGIVAIASSALEAAMALLRRLVVHGELITVVTGREATVEQITILTAWLGEHAAGHDVEVHRGGQPLYPYLFGVE